MITNIRMQIWQGNALLLEHQATGQSINVPRVGEYIAIDGISAGAVKKVLYDYSISARCTIVVYL